MCQAIKKELAGKEKMIYNIRKMMQEKVKDSFTESKWDSELNSSPQIREMKKDQGGGGKKRCAPAGMIEHALKA